MKLYFITEHKKKEKRRKEAVNASSVLLRQNIGGVNLLRVGIESNFLSTPVQHTCLLSYHAIPAYFCLLISKETPDLSPDQI